MLAVITGASAGIGAEFARQLHARGFDLFLIARRADHLVALKSQLEEKRANSVEVRSVDLCNQSELAKLCTELKVLPVKLLVNNAGRGSFGLFDELDLTQELSMVALNISAGLSILHAVLPVLKQQKTGGVITISSVLGFQPTPYMATYAGTKAFNLYHTLALRKELKGTGVQVLTVCPGPTATEFAGVARVPGEFTDIQRDRVDMVVAQSIIAFQKGRAFVVPGMRSSLLSLFSRILPFWLTLPIIQHMLRRSLPARLK
jgi:short-subunit dehydrogenase